MTIASYLARAIDSVRIHQVRKTSVDGRPVFIKRRRLGMDTTIAFGNVFLKASRSHITLFSSVREWKTWELHCFDLVNGGRLRCSDWGPRSIWTEPVAGTSLLDHWTAGTLTAPIIRAAGCELARTHQLRSSLTQTAWSHGDPHLKNILFDAEDKRARLIDFETLHDTQLSPLQRHANDLLVLILDLVGRVQDPRLGPWVCALLEGYDRREVETSVTHQLRCPSGLELVLWHTRTNFIPASQLRLRLESLRLHLQERSASAG